LPWVLFFCNPNDLPYYNLTYVSFLQQKQTRMLILELTLIRSIARRKGKKRKPTSHLWCLQSPWAKPWELVLALVGLVWQAGAWVWVVVVPVMVVEWE
jgi:hypothetical protein